MLGIAAAECAARIALTDPLGKDGAEVKMPAEYSQHHQSVLFS